MSLRAIEPTGDEVARDTAKSLRELADRIDAGDVTDLACVVIKRGGGISCLQTSSSMALIGALFQHATELAHRWEAGGK